jgi:hypothetical protein
MDRDLTIMIYGAIMGVAGSILTSIVTTVFQFWLARREDERKQQAERNRQLRHIHLPTDEEVILFNAGREDSPPESQRKAAESGSIVLSVFVSGVLVYQTNDPMLGFSFAALLGFLFTNRILRKLRG